jgi:hypothetical protein
LERLQVLAERLQVLQVQQELRVRVLRLLVRQELVQQVLLLAERLLLPLLVFR